MTATTSRHTGDVVRLVFSDAPHKAIGIHEGTIVQALMPARIT